jgi:hypothetical protein
MTAEKAARLWRFANYRKARPGRPRQFPASWPGTLGMVEAGGQHIPRLSQRAGLCLHPGCP